MFIEKLLELQSVSANGATAAVEFANNFFDVCMFISPDTSGSVVISHGTEKGFVSLTIISGKDTQLSIKTTLNNKPVTMTLNFNNLGGYTYKVTGYHDMPIKGASEKGKIPGELALFINDIKTSLNA